MYLKSIFLILPFFALILPGQSHVIEKRNHGPFITSDEKIHTEPSKKLTFQTGNVIERDPNNYKQLADMSLQQYLKHHHITKPHIVVRVDRVTEQLVSGTLTKVEFTVKRIYMPGEPVTKGVIKCKSDIWDQPWLNRREITVDCKLNNEPYRPKRQVAGGRVSRDPQDPEIKRLAEESLKKYLIDNGITRPHRVVRIDKATVQVVTGTLTRIDFTIEPVGGFTQASKCHSEILEQPWLHIKEIKVDCKKI